MLCLACNDGKEKRRNLGKFVFLGCYESLVRNCWVCGAAVRGGAGGAVFQAGAAAVLSHQAAGRLPLQLRSARRGALDKGLRRHPPARPALPCRLGPGLIFYLHGNAGALDSWGDAATLYTRLGYSVFMLDYRGYGKSGGTISSQEQFLSDVQTAYQQLLPEFPEERTIVLGYSLGTGAAAWLAAQQNPRLLLLQAPYFSMRATARQHYPFVPGFIVRYPLGTDAVLPQVKCPIVIFHGEHDEVIDYQTTMQLKALLKPQDQFITLAGAGHNGMTSNPEYQAHIRRILGGQ
ncbi:alpha/beta hydrolase [Hymenobacter cellulosilyticus]|uniref:Alpha/beta hydrolase n=1 Tax=Hymenobacter cellulosilyticus TaxID=2932248 RepID=A0A8T9Q832_9BACT|nr:alpha/beta fold hydrolase [Hymenobacter cellulosilyticus]UOQ73102.1 alpha/beta hydrolase [Hymenobacter cellulosilyticus]